MAEPLLWVAGALCPAQSATNLYFPFYVGAAGKALRIAFSYAPKALADDAEADAIIDEGFSRYVLPEDREALSALRAEIKPLVNLVTLSLDAPDGYRGAAHRHDPVQEHRIAETGSTPGFTDAPVVCGLWRACVSVHAVVTRACRYSLTVEEVDA